MNEALLSPVASSKITMSGVENEYNSIGQRIVWLFRDKVIYLLCIYSQIRIFIEYGNKDTANT